MLRQLFTLMLLFPMACGEDASNAEVDASLIDAGTNTDGSTAACEDAIADLAEEVSTGQVCTVAIRLDYQSMAIKGYQAICGDYAQVSDIEAASVSTSDNGYGTGDTMLNESQPENNYVFYRSAGDFGGVGAVNAQTGLSVFGASIIWSGTGEITYPATWREPSELGSNCRSAGGINVRSGWDLISGTALSAQVVDTAVEVVLGTAVPAAMWANGYVFHATVLLYPRSVGEFDPASAEWVVLVNGGWLE